MSGPDRVRCAVTAARNGAQWWDLAVQTQRGRPGPTVDHADLYGLAGELVATLNGLEQLAGAFARQTAGYGEGRALRDDEGTDPHQRLEAAADAADTARGALIVALHAANTFWSAIGHIALDPTDPDPTGEQRRERRHRPCPGASAGGYGS